MEPVFSPRKAMSSFYPCIEKDSLSILKNATFHGEKTGPIDRKTKSFLIVREKRSTKYVVCYLLYGHADPIRLLRLLLPLLSKRASSSGFNFHERASLLLPHVSIPVAFHQLWPAIQMDFRRSWISRLSIAACQFSSDFALSTGFKTVWPDFSDME
ncbi:hypothetical protein AVEN_235886-1 [Araneus ventricosus]|uniref:Uncharacterized protein n=1 Tax=Araneus ventricosus TaxID=182803 RepID=A0A4Y2N2J6_ARAVE|nr:hypothetical protein AVEN_235886-1 [Araneus ventricosus]